MHLRSTVSLTPLVKTDAEIRERDSVRIQALGLGSQDADKLGHEIQDLSELLLALTQRSGEFLSFRHVDACPHETMECPVADRGHADAPDVTNHSVGTHNPLRKIESAMLRHHRPNFLRDEISVVGMHER